MNPSKAVWLFILICVFHCPAAFSQKPFSEGVVVYSVSIDPANGQESLGQQAGMYTLTVKGKQIRKELVMNSGFHNTVIIGGKEGEAYSLQQTPGQNYAIQMDPAGMKAMMRKHKGYTIREEKETRTIAGYSCHKAHVTYPDGSSGNMYYTTAFKPENDNLLERFPSIGVFPLYFEYRNEQGVVLRLQAEKIEEQPVEAGQFRLPADYKIISAEEFSTLKN